MYGLKQSGRMWYNRLSEYLLKEGYANYPICPCIFIKKSKTGFAIIVVYVDDLNLIRTLEELTRTANYLKREFEIKDLGKIKFCLGLQIKHFPTGISVHQSAYTKKILKRFYMNKAHPLTSPMAVRSLDVKKDPFRPWEKGEELRGPEVPYLSAIGALMYLATYTRPDIAFPVNLLPDIVLLQLEGIGMVSSTYCDILKEHLIWGSSIQKNQSNNCLDMQMQGIFQTHTKLDPKPGMYLAVMVLLSHGNLSIKQW